jgi:hypothetical protein
MANQQGILRNISLSCASNYNEFYMGEGEINEFCYKAGLMNFIRGINFEHDVQFLKAR